MDNKCYDYETRNNDVFLVDENNQSTNLSQAVGHVAMRIFELLTELKTEKDVEAKKEKEAKIRLLSSALGSMSDALTAVTRVNRTGLLP